MTLLVTSKLVLNEILSPLGREEIISGKHELAGENRRE